LAGLIQVAAGVLRLGKFVRMIPHSVMMGFVNGLAIVIFLSQLSMFKSQGEWLSGSALSTMIGLVALTMAIMVGLPYLTKKVPAALTAIVVVSLLVIFGNLETETVRSFVVANGGTGIQAGFPSFNLPIISFSLGTLFFILPYACILAAIGLIESLMTLNLIDELTDSHGSGNRECAAQGLGNIVNGFFGGMGGCAMIGQSIINIKSGGRGRLSGITAALALLGFILFGASYIEQVPIAALVGVMFMVVFGTFAWSSFQVWNKVPRSDVIVIVDLAIAVLAGVVVSSLVFAWENAKRIRARKHLDEHGVKHYEIYGPLFFGSIELFNSKFDVQNDPDEVVIDFKDSRILDQSAIECVNKLTERYLKKGKNIHLRHLSADCVKLIQKAEKICDVNVLDDPDYFVAIDNFRRAQTDLGKA
jgi:SulP family sulfate permease